MTTDLKSQKCHSYGGRRCEILVSGGRCPLQSPRGGPFLGSCSFLGHITALLPPSLWPPPLCPLQRHLSLDLGPIRVIQDDLIWRSLIISAKILFPNKVTFIGSGLPGGRDSTYSRCPPGTEHRLSSRRREIVIATRKTCSALGHTQTAARSRM